MNYFLATFGFTIFFGILKVLNDGTLGDSGIVMGDSFSGGVGLGVSVVMIGWLLGRTYTKNRFKGFLVGSAFISIPMIYLMVSGQLHV
jgi:hypothetical protein